MPRRGKKRYHFIYKTTCLITNKFYIGRHSTDNLKDRYLGSGKILKYSIIKYGPQNHKREILEFLPDKESLFKREEEIVNESLLKNPLCINLTYGGEIGFTDKQLSQGAINANKKNWKDPEFIERSRNRMRKTSQRLHKEGKISPPNWTGKTHSEETKRKIGDKNSKHQKGFNNSQYGTCWITNEKESKKINKGDDIPNGWGLGRKMKNK